MKKKINIIIMIALIALTMYVIFSKLELNEFIHVVKNSNVYYLMAGIICMFVFWVLEAIVLDLMLKKVNPKTTFWLSLKTTLIGQYYSLLTPFASGGQPAQLYVMKKEHIPVSNGTAVLVGKFLIFQISVTMYALILTIFRIKLILNNFAAVSVFALVGLTINVIGLSLIIMMAFKPKVIEKVVIKVVKFLAKIKIVKNEEKIVNKTSDFIDDYAVKLNALKEDTSRTICLFLTTIVQLTVYFSITFFIYKALGLSNSSLIDIISLQALLYMAVSFIPIPGTVGASESGFVLLFGSIFTGKFATIAMLLWRCISYYFGLLFCGIFSLVVYVKDKIELKLQKAY